ncbi:MAG: AMP-binding protein, partial [Cellvibrionales bacterium]
MLDIRDWIAVHAHRTPDATAQIDHATGRRFTYLEMDRRVDRLGSYLRHTLGLTQGAVVGVLSPNSSDVLDVDFACARVGSVFFPMNTRLAPPELAYQLNDAAPQVLFVGKGMETLANAALSEVDTAPLLIGIAGADLGLTIEAIIADAGPLGPVESRHVDDPWTLIYSSGTTGRPKGIVHSHGMVTAQAVMNCVPLGLNPDCVNLTILPLFHISGLNIFAHPMFYAGGTQVTL